MDYWLKMQVEDDHKRLDAMGAPDRERRVDRSQPPYDQEKDFSLGVPERINWLRDHWQPTEWRSIETAPRDTTILMWWRPRTDPRYPVPDDAASDMSNNRYAEACVIGQVSASEPGTWWNGQRGESQDIWHVTHWMPLPKSPSSQ